MIIIHLIGGLGNQLFQYSLGKRLAIERNTELKLDNSSFETYKLHNYSLQHFNVNEEFATEKELNKFRSPFLKMLQKVNALTGNKLFNYYKQKYVKELSFAFDENILKVNADVYLDGFWQSENYFKEFKEELYKHLSFKTPPDEFNKDIIPTITNSNAVSIHVRRADYVSNPTAFQIHGICGLDYYQSAINYISSRIENPVFYVFSDDKEWVKKELLINFPTVFVDHNFADKNYEDLRLMSLCKHNIIANSSFSWWGAYLNRNHNKIVIAPKKWYNDPTRSTKDIIPEEWIKL